MGELTNITQNNNLEVVTQLKISQKHNSNCNLHHLVHKEKGRVFFTTKT
jgi:hypothetical protein